MYNIGVGRATDGSAFRLLECLGSSWCQKGASGDFLFGCGHGIVPGNSPWKQTFFSSLLQVTAFKVAAH